MRVIIAGSRDGGFTFEDVRDAVAQAELYEIVPTVVLSGTARGVDRLGETWANSNAIPIERYPADWDRYGKSAGYIRNKQMAGEADALIALWDGESKGTRHMIEIANSLDLPMYVYRK